MTAPPTPTGATPHEAKLTQAIGVPGAVFMGLGSILGTGVFVSIGIAAGVAGPSVVLAVALAALVATLNGLSSAELAASHPVSGGTYEYGYRYLNPTLGFTSRILFLCAKSASAATAALGFAGYVRSVLGVHAPSSSAGLALGAIVLLTLTVAGGIKRSNFANTVIVSFTLLALGTFVLVGLPVALHHAPKNLIGVLSPGDSAEGFTGFLQATAIMFVAYTGYGRIATLGEEVRNPKKAIPRAIVATLACSMVLYVAVAFVAVGATGARQLIPTKQFAAPLEVAARAFSGAGVSWLIALGAITAMLGVLLNLILGLSRVVLAMARRGDMPGVFAHLDSKNGSPRAAVLFVGIIIACLSLTTNVKTTWSFSAFTVLVYYALTNLAALKLRGAAQLYPRWVPALGLLACLSLAFWIEPHIWMVGLGVLGFAVLWHSFARRKTIT